MDAHARERLSYLSYHDRFAHGTAQLSAEESDELAALRDQARERLGWITSQPLWLEKYGDEADALGTLVEASAVTPGT